VIRIAQVLVLLLGLSACASAPVYDTQAPKKNGAYYLDDGPGEREPPNLDSLPDAKPRDEAIISATAKPYTVLGKTYVPYARPTAYKVRGIASWYGKRYHGQRTSTGEIYDMYAMTAAHTILPLPSYARVTHLGNGKSVVVRINDRGPFHSDRVIDLSYAAAKRLGIVGAGSAQVEVEAIIPGIASVEVVAPEPAPGAPPVIENQAPEPRAEPTGHYVQLGAFASGQNAEDFLKKMKTEIPWIAGMLNVWKREGLYRVHSGPYSVRDQALTDANRIQSELGLKPLLIVR
jgi:rare lipoprotein A